MHHGFAASHALITVLLLASGASLAAAKTVRGCRVSSACSGAGTSYSLFAYGRGARGVLDLLDARAARP
jgi:hypothetical protein